MRETDWLYPNFIDEAGNFKSFVQSFLIKSNGQNILIDTCNGNAKTRTDLPEWQNLDTNFIQRLRSTGIIEEKINIVLCTHLHCDHVGWNTKLVGDSWIPTFPKAKYLFVEKEFNYWKQKPEKEMQADKLAFADSVNPIVQAGLAKIIKAEEQINNDIRLLPTFGHTPGHVSIVIESKGEKAIISADFIHHPCQFAYPQWKMDADVLPNEAIVTRKKMLTKIANTNTLLIGSHFSNPVAGKVIKAGKNYMFRV